MELDKEKDYADIMKIIDSMEGHRFESFCAALLENNGYRDVTVTRGSGDYGIDITARYRNKIYGIQCKRYANKVGIHAVRDALGGYDYYNCDIVAVLTNNTFTPQAVKQANISGVRLWDRKSLIELVDHCETLDFLKDFRGENHISQDSGIYISNGKSENGYRPFCLVSGIIICILSLLVLTVNPLFGLGFCLFGTVLIVRGRK